MNKKTLLIIFLCLLALSSLGANAALRLVRLTVVNKAGRQIEISLTGKNSEQSYYFRIPEGSHNDPSRQIFTIVPDTYSSSIYYVELWDPVYGNQCGTKGQTLDITHSTVVVVLPCDLSPANGGEAPGLVKYGGRNTKRGR